ncbi:MAG: ABC transporter substrate-binding protein [Paenibacillus macerans]|uniref:ABC transporter substrate-binding protein n=3 Tax=Paenibacillus macerans TaxID=44252 RepID=A0A6N8F650_PAEMA|nr:ABC transporter substrate-binding protein [Paenibacillus macerans]MBS5914895.1 ABC transporter substrate-binding protein [Paenibacillus macerans]MCY7562748.1 ABC transporter substrate-binding protein [Paenibacillus macerans]MDU5945854.1 ABC transporter substrate-binding protein [Paenibacillus macerans]MDU7475541.1 ABC transporter substrate-binding protein [Paenibacillus macerans]MUG26298.1 ABC transporter substrate-binding protein [Paenibacillus macerans]
MAVKRKKRTSLAAALSCLLLVLAGCGGQAAGGSEGNPAAGAAADNGGAKAPRDVKLVLDWSPNTNHTGLYVAKELGYFKEEGLNVDIVLPGSGGAEAMVASGEAPFGVSVQENVTQSRTQGVPLVSIAAVIQHNTSGFAAPAGKNIKSPKDFEGKTYGGWGSPVEEAVMKSIMDLEGADVGKVKFLNIGDADYFTAVKRDIDFAWIFYAWTGIEAELRGEPLDMLYVKDYSDKLDYYTPVIVTNEKTIANDPELVKSFMRAVSKGYNYAADHPDEAAQILLKAVPELDHDLVVASQKWLSPKYRDDAARWGEQKKEVWQNYSDWMHERGLLEKPLDVGAAFTNDFLPAE